MPLQTYDQYFGRPAQIRVADPTNAFATGVQARQRQEGLALEEQRTNELAARGEHERGLTSRAEARTVAAETLARQKETSLNRLRAVDPDNPEHMALMPQIVTEIGQAWMGANPNPDDAEDGLLALGNILKLGPEEQKTAVKHLQSVMGATVDPTAAEAAKTKHEYEMELQRLKDENANKRAVTRGSRKTNWMVDQIDPVTGTKWLVADTGDRKRVPGKGEVGEGEKFKATEAARLRSTMAQRFGANEFSKMDESTSDKVNKAIVLTRRYMEEDGIEMDEAIEKAYSEVRVAAVLKTIPKGGSDRGVAAKAVKELLDMDVPATEIKGILRGKGWEDKDIGKILKEAGTTEGQAISDEDIMANPTVQKLMGGAGK